MNITEQHKVILAAMVINGNTTTLTGQLDRKTYVEINQVLETLGGTWNKKQKCHVWNTDPTTKLAEILNPNTASVKTKLETVKEHKKKFQQFYTPDALAIQLVDYASIEDHHSVLEPSAGNGSIVKAIHDAFPDIVIDVAEIDENNLDELNKLGFVTIIGKDFLQVDDSKLRYDRIVMNPPFTKNQDVTHITKAWNLLKKGGRIVAIASPHWTFATDKKSKAFRELVETNGWHEEVDSGAFKESGTMTKSVIVVLNKS